MFDFDVVTGPNPSVGQGVAKPAPKPENQANATAPEEERKPRRVLTEAAGRRTG